MRCTEHRHSTRRSAARATGTVLAALLTAAAATVALAPQAGALAPGWVDTAYGTQGSTQLSGSVLGATTSLVDSTGATLVVRNDGGAPNVATVTKLTPSGTVDTTFATSGVLTLPSDTIAMYPQPGPSGGFYLEVDDVATTHTRIARFTASGSTDSTFGGTGTVDVSAAVDPALLTFGYAVRSDGDVVVPFSSDTGGTTLGAWTGAGALDTGFHGTGILSLAQRTLGLPGGMTSIVAGASGSVLLAATPTGTLAPAVLRITSAGALDTTYGTAGSAVLALGSPDSLTPLADGSVYVTGEATDLTGTLVHVVVSKLTPGGALDVTFAHTGTTTGRNTSCAQTVRATVATATKLYIGTTYDDPRGHCAVNALVWRFTSAGGLDTAFGNGGQQLVTVTGTNAASGLLSGLGTQSSGRLLVTEEAGGAVSVVAVAAASAAPAGGYVPLPSSRILDTRTGNGVAKAALAPHGTVTLQVAGRGGVPTTGASAVVMNVTVTQPTTPGNLIVYPAGGAVPLVSNLNFSAKLTIANLVTVALGSGANAGKVSINNASVGTSQVIGDVVGYYLAGTPTQPGTFVSLAPARILDTRIGLGAAKAAVPRDGTIHLAVGGRGGVPASGAGAVVLNVTVTAPLRPGNIAVYPTGSAVPTTSNLNFAAGQTVPNLVVVKLGAGGQVDLVNQSAGTAHLIADVAGYYLAGTATLPGTYVPLTPARDFDTRVLRTPVAGFSALTRNLLSLNAVPATGVEALVLNVTVTNTKAPGYLLVDDPAQDGNVADQTGSTLNFTTGRNVPNLVVTNVTDGSVQFYNSVSRTTDVVADIAGYFRS